jgi:hypothetical protein
VVRLIEAAVALCSRLGCISSNIVVMLQQARK